MKTILILALILLLMAVAAWGAPVNPQFITAIHQVETQGRYGAIRGTKGELGPLQITRKCWRDAHVSGHFRDCSCYAYSSQVMESYLNRFCPVAVKSNDYKTMARIWNGGPEGTLKSATLDYWKKVIDKLGQSAIVKP